MLNQCTLQWVYFLRGPSTNPTPWTYSSLGSTSKLVYIEICCLICTSITMVSCKCKYTLEQVSSVDAISEELTSYSWTSCHFAVL